MNTLPFYIFLFIHLVALIVGFGAVIVVDTSGLLALRKKITLKTLNHIADITQRLIWTGWGALVVSGVALLYLKGFNPDSLSQIKIFFVILLGLNGIFLHYIKKWTTKYDSLADIPLYLKFRTGVAMAVSQMGWWGAIIIGFVHRHWKQRIDWPETPWIFIGAIILILILLSQIDRWLRYNK